MQPQLNHRYEEKSTSSYNKSLLMRIKKRHVFWISIGIGLLFIIGAYCYSAQAYAYKYIEAYNEYNLEQVYAYYNENETLNKFSKQEITNFLVAQIKEEGVARINKTDPIKTCIQLTYQRMQGYFSSNNQSSIHIPIEYIMQNEKVKSSLHVVRNEKTKKWKIEFPYEVMDITVFAPAGATIYMDQKQIVKANNNEQILISDVLPGSHTIIIEYYNNTYPAFIQNIHVPTETSVYSPYIAYDITVSAPSKTWVTLADVNQYNVDGNTVFRNVLPGMYEIVIQMNDGELEVSRQTQIITKNTPHVQIDQIHRSQEVKNSVNEFFKLFNKEYEEAIVKRETEFFDTCITGQNKEQLLSDFSSWYIEHKNIKKAKTSMELRKVDIISGEQIKAAVMEIAELTNIEKDGKDKDIEQDYRVAIEWDYQLTRKEGTWRIDKRKVLQSIVAYKDEDGNWIQN